MYCEVVSLVIATLLWVAWAVVIGRLVRRQKAMKQLPPGPRRWPLVGNLFQLDWPPHESFAKLACEHGPIMTLWLGEMKTVVISSNEVARDMFKNHDIALAGRKLWEAVRGDDGNEGSLSTAQYGANWRVLRQLWTTELFVTRRLDEMAGRRAKCVDQMVQFVKEAGASGTNAIDIGRFIFLMLFNHVGNIIFSKDLLDSTSEKGTKFFYHTNKLMEITAKPNIADFLPGLKCLDPQGISTKAGFHIQKGIEIAGGFIRERMESLENGTVEEKKREDFMDVLLAFSGNAKFSSRAINVIVFEMFVAGTDTITTTSEWAMAELLRNPTVLNKVQAELRNTISPGKKLEEKDIENLPYLRAVIKETLRLHTPLPFLLPHMAINPCEMSGYNIPKETQILVKKAVTLEVIPVPYKRHQLEAEI